MSLVEDQNDLTLYGLLKHINQYGNLPLAHNKIEKQQLTTARKIHTNIHAYFCQCINKINQPKLNLKKIEFIKGVKISNNPKHIRLFYILSLNTKCLNSNINNQYALTIFDVNPETTEVIKCRQRLYSFNTKIVLNAIFLLLSSDNSNNVEQEITVVFNQYKHGSLNSKNKTSINLILCFIMLNDFLNQFTATTELTNIELVDSLQIEFYGNSGNNSNMLLFSMEHQNRLTVREDCISDSAVKELACSVF